MSEERPVGYSSLLAEGRKNAFEQVNTILVETYWNIGRRIVDYEQREKRKPITEAGS